MIFAQYKRFKGKEKLAEHSTFMVKSFDAAFGPFKRVATRLRHFSSQTLLQALQNQAVSCVLRRAGWKIDSHKNYLPIGFRP